MKGYHTVTPLIVVSDIAEAIDFYVNAFGAKQKTRYNIEEMGKVTHGEVVIGDSIVMIGEESSQMNNFTPSSLNGVSVGFYVYVEDVDGFVNHAIQNGAIEVRPITQMFWGDRMGVLKDPYGHVWNIATHNENLSDEEIKRRAEEFYSHQKK